MSNSQEIEKAIHNIRTIPTANRPQTADGLPGGLLDFTGVDKDIYILGDIHGTLNNLKASLETDELEQKLEGDRAILLLLGDLVHDDRVGQLMNMQPSLDTLDYLVEIVNRFPKNIFILRGNHDTFDEQISKNGIRQAKLFREYLLEQRGEQYTKRVGEFFDALPLVFLADGLIAIHAGPMRGGASREHFIEIYRYEEEMGQLMWNRINEIGSVPSRKEYGPEDIQKTKALLGYDDDAYMVVGHNPLLDRGGNDSIWFNVMNVTNYVITYNALPETCPILLFRSGERNHVLLYADLKIKKPRFVLGDY